MMTGGHPLDAFATAAERRMIMACKYETSNGRCGLKGCYAYRHKCYTEDMCKCHEPQTNADRIRSMNDEELANVLREFATKPMQGSFLEWLKQPAE